MIAGVVLAAGAGRRFGAPKQLADLGGHPMLERVLAAIAAAPLDRVFVVIGAESEAILDQVDLRGTEPVICEDWEDGLSASLRTGVACADACGAESAVVVLGDQPMISPNSIARTIAARGGVPAVRATYGGRRRIRCCSSASSSPGWMTFAAMPAPAPCSPGFPCGRWTATVSAVPPTSTPRRSLRPSASGRASTGSVAYPRPADRLGLLHLDP